MKHLIILCLFLVKSCTNNPSPNATVLEGTWTLIQINNGFIGKVTNQPEIGYQEVFIFEGNTYERSKNGKVEQKGTFSIRTEKTQWGETTHIDYDDNTYQTLGLQDGNLNLDMRTPKGQQIMDAPALIYQKIR